MGHFVPIVVFPSLNMAQYLYSTYRILSWPIINIFKTGPPYLPWAECNKVSFNNIYQMQLEGSAKSCSIKTQECFWITYIDEKVPYM